MNKLWSINITEKYQVKIDEFDVVEKIDRYWSVYKNGEANNTSYFYIRLADIPDKSYSRAFTLDESKVKQLVPSMLRNKVKLFRDKIEKAKLVIADATEKMNKNQDLFFEYTGKSRPVIKEPEYTFFVSFDFSSKTGFGHGNREFTHNSDNFDINKIREIEDRIQADSGYERVVINNWKTLKKAN